MIYDVIVVGSGPAGISASLYTLRAGLSTLIITSGGGALIKADKIENYYGYSEPISGKELYENGIKQAKRLGAEIIDGQVVSVETDGINFTVSTSDNVYSSKSVILATGASRKTPNIDGLSRLEGMGVSYCAVCDAFFFRKKAVAVIGSGEYALHEADVLANTSQSVTILTDGKEPETDFGKYKVIKEKIISVNGEDSVSSVTFADGSTLEAAGVFIAIGVAGSAELARKTGAAVDGNRIIVDESFMTTVPGLLAAGDCTGGLMQVSVAVAEGAKAGVGVVKLLKNNK